MYSQLCRCAALFLLLFSSISLAAEPPELLLANSWQSGLDVRDYWVSEKLDGVRAYWDGQQLWTRGGKHIQTPSWFTASFPEQPMDGELWMGRGAFDQLSGLVRRQHPDESGWRGIAFYIFELPGERGSFSQRVAAMERLVTKVKSPWLKQVPQYRLASEQALIQHLDEVVDSGGEGLMLHHQDALYHTGRSDALLKLKRWQDAEARVLAHLPGKGRHQGRMGALLVETSDGVRFRLGTGFSDREREQPPVPGALVTYKYYGLTDNGVPRFASFMRIREQ